MKLSDRLTASIRLLFALLVLAIAFVLLFKAASNPPTARAEQSSQSSTPRSFENTVPEQVPIKVKIRKEKEKAFADLANEKWMRDLELEVKNTGTKPIYFLFFYLSVPEAKVGGKGSVVSIVYGRVELTDTRERPNEKDVPIKPGETVILHVDESHVLGWEEAVGAGRVPKLIHNVSLFLQDLRFDDGTGFEGTSGVPWPRIEQQSDFSPPGNNRRLGTESALFPRCRSAGDLTRHSIAPSQTMETRISVNVFLR